jgi:hypothetical protein
VKASPISAVSSPNSSATSVTLKSFARLFSHAIRCAAVMSKAAPSRGRKPDATGLRSYAKSLRDRDQVAGLCGSLDLLADACANLGELMERMGHRTTRGALIYLHRRRGPPACTGGGC